MGFNQKTAFFETMKLLKQAFFDPAQVTDGPRHLSAVGQISLEGRPEAMTLTKDKKRSLYSLSHTLMDRNDPQTLTFTELARNQIECKLEASYGEVFSMMMPTDDAAVMSDMMRSGIERKLVEFYGPEHQQAGPEMGM